MVNVKSRVRSNGEARGGGGREQGGGFSAGNGGVVRRFGTRQKREDVSLSSPARATGGTKRARQVPAAMLGAPIATEPVTHDTPVLTEDGSLRESGDAAMKAEPEAFSIGRRGGWMR